MITTSLLALNLVSAAAMPNIVIIVADDLGQRDIQPYGSTFYETPNLNRMAKSGTVFTNAYSACPVCSPTRVSIMTGKYPQRSGLTDYAGAVQKPENWKANTKNLPAPTIAELPKTEKTMAEFLKAKGYATFFAGKWHLGDRGNFPTDRGFDINKGGTASGGPYTGNKYFSPYANPNLPDGPDGEQIDERLGEETAKFIRANKGQPFLAVCATYGTHTPLMTKPELLAKYRQKRTRLGLTDQWKMDGFREVRQIQNSPVYAGMVESVDESVGKILNALAETNLTENTIIIFTSDNGGLSTSEGSPTSNVPLRGGKGWMYDGGIRVPFIINWPKKTKPGSTASAPISSIDIFPTVLSACGLQKDAKVADGIDLGSVIAKGSSPRRDLFWAYPHYGNQGGEPASAIRSGDWKLLEFEEDGRVELYNLRDDVGETNDLSKKELKTTASLLKKLQNWRKSVGAIRSTANPDFDPSKPNARLAPKRN